MKPLVFDCVEIRSPRTDPHPEKSTTNNSDWRQGMFIILRDYKGNKYDWMIKWDELKQLEHFKQKVEFINKELAKEKCKK